MSPVPPKPPRATTEAGRERSGPTRHDRFALRTPSPRPGSVPTVTGDEFPEDERTPVNGSNAEILLFRAQRTDSNAQLTVANTDELKQSIAATNVRIDNVVGELGDLRVETGKLAGGVEALVKVLDKQTDLMGRQLDAASQRQTTVTVTDAEVKIKNATAWNANWRTIVLSIFGAGGLASVVILAAFKAKGCG